MPFVLALLLFVVFVVLESSEKGAREKIDNLWIENHLAGYREYVYAWHIYWDEVVPRVYEEARRLCDAEHWHEAYAHNINNLSHSYAQFVYPNFDNIFDKVGNMIYGIWPQHYCSLQAKRRMVAEGRKPYNASWKRDYHKYKLDEYARQNELTPLEESNLNPLFYLCFRFEDPDIYVEKYIPKDDPLWAMIPPKTDRRRYEYVALDGERVWPLSANRRYALG